MRGVLKVKQILMCWGSSGDAYRRLCLIGTCVFVVVESAG